MKKLMSIGLCVCIFAPFAVYSQGGGYAGAFLRTGIAARSEAMGRAYTAVVEGNESAFYNPASVAWFENKEFTASLRSMSLDRSFTYLSFGLPIRPKPDSSGNVLNGGLSLSWIHAGVGDIDARDFDGVRLDPISNSQDAINLSFALQPHHTISIGITGRIVNSRIAGVTQDGGSISASSFGFDFGALVQPIDGVRVGIAATNVNLKYAWNTEDVYERATSTTDDFPRSIRVGVAVSRLAPWLLVAGDFEKRQFRDASFHLGAIASLQSNIKLRAGMNDGQPAFGGGYNFGLFGKRSELHYAFVTHSESLDSDHVFGWVFVF